MKITIDTIKKELVIEDTTSVSELIEFLKNYEDYTVVNKTVVLNNPVITNSYNWRNNNMGLYDDKPYCDIPFGNDYDIDSPLAKLTRNN